MPPEIDSPARRAVACCTVLAVGALLIAIEQPMAAEVKVPDTVAKPRTDKATQPAASPASPRQDDISAAATSDASITSRVKDALVHDPTLAGADLSVNTDRGVVHLTGSVKSQEQAAIAAAHAQSADGVMRVDNHLSIVPQ